MEHMPTWMRKGSLKVIFHPSHQPYAFFGNRRQLFEVLKRGERKGFKKPFLAHHQMTDKRQLVNVE